MAIVAGAVASVLVTRVGDLAVAFAADIGRRPGKIMLAVLPFENFTGDPGRNISATG